MKFLDADVKRPLASVAAMVDEGNRVIFASQNSYVENVATGERIPMRRKNGVFVLELEAGNDKVGNKRTSNMDIGEVGIKSEGNLQGEMKRNHEGFMRQA